jgi:hypothetical protein
MASTRGSSARELWLTTPGFALRELSVLAEHAAGAAFPDAAPRERLRFTCGWAVQRRRRS